jgi:hypothetical protein
LILASICAAAAILIALSKGSNLVELLFVFFSLWVFGGLFVASAGGEESQEFFLSHRGGMNKVLLENSCSKHPPTHHLSIQEEEEIKNPRCWGKQPNWPK